MDDVFVGLIAQVATADRMGWLSLTVLQAQVIVAMLQACYVTFYVACRDLMCSKHTSR